MKALAVPLVVIAALALTGCGPFAPRSLPVGVSAEGVAGTWVHKEDDTSTGATMIFREDGTFSFDGIPAELELAIGSGCNEEIAASTDLVSGEGDWELRNGELLLSAAGAPMWAYPVGFLSFDAIEFICDIDHAGSYRLDRED